VYILIQLFLNAFQIKLLGSDVIVDSGTLAPVDNRVAELAEQQRVVDNGEVFTELAMHIPNLARFHHP
jgi:hypothetical protein